MTYTSKISVQFIKKFIKKAKELKAKEKVTVFTESKRTQNYLLKLLGKTKYAEKTGKMGVAILENEWQGLSQQ